MQEKNGVFDSIFDVTKRVDLRTCNKKAFEGLALAGGFDSFKNIHRAQFFVKDEKGMAFLEKAINLGILIKKVSIPHKYHCLEKVQRFNCQNL